jgi:hypothetical protein
MSSITKKGWWGRLAAALVAVVFSTSCVSRQAFVPTERLTAFSPEGFLAAEYDLQTRRGDLGQVRIWSHGANYVRFRGQRRTLVHIGLEIQNESDQYLVIDEERLALDSATVDGTMYENIPAASIRGETVIAPGSEATLDVHFAMTPGIYPTDVSAFRLGWSLRENGAVYVQRTPFIAPPIGWGPDYYHTPFYDPFYFGFGTWPRGMIMHPYPYFHYRMY